MIFDNGGGLHNPAIGPKGQNLGKVGRVALRPPPARGAGESYKGPQRVRNSVK